MSTESGPTAAHISPLPAPTPQKLAGYELLDELGRGGMGVVYRARHAALGKIVALKAVAIGPGTLPDAIQRFQREARLLAELHHPGIIAVHDVGQESQTLFYTMDHLEGQTLERWITRQPPLPFILQVMEGVCRAVHYAHENGICHRDLKPANVMLDTRLTPVVMDFGLAKHLDPDSSALTQSGAVFGTPQFMAPEQAAGRSREVGASADVYALGAMMYFCVTGRPPHSGSDLAELLLRVTSMDPVAPRVLNPSLPVDLEVVICKAMARVPELRYETAEALAEDLRRVRTGERIQAQAPRAGRTMPRAVALSAAIVGVLLTAGLIWHLRGSVGPVATANQSTPSENGVAAANAAGPAHDTPVATRFLTPEAQIAAILDGTPTESQTAMEQLDRQLRDLSLLTGPEVREWSALLDDTAAKTTDPDLRTSLLGRTARIREYLSESLATARQEALAEARGYLGAGDCRRAQERVRSWCDAHPGEADEPAVAALSSSILELAASTAVRLEQDLETHARTGSLSEAAERLRTELIRLPETLARPCLDRLEQALAEHARAAAEVAETGPAQPDPLAVPAEDPALAAERDAWAACWRDLDVDLQREDLAAAAAHLDAAGRAHAWSTERRSDLDGLVAAVAQAQRVEEAAGQSVRTPGPTAIDLAIRDAAGEKVHVVGQVRLKPAEVLTDGQLQVRYEIAPGALGGTPFSRLDTTTVTSLAARPPAGTTAPGAAAALVYRLLRDGDLEAGGKFLATQTDPTDPVRRGVELRVHAAVARMTDALRVALEQGDGAALRPLLDRIAKLDPALLTADDADALASAQAVLSASGRAERFQQLLALLPKSITRRDVPACRTQLREIEGLVDVPRDAAAEAVLEQARAFLEMSERKARLREIIRDLEGAMRARNRDRLRAGLDQIDGLGDVETTVEQRTVIERARRMLKTLLAEASAGASGSGPKGGPPGDDGEDPPPGGGPGGGPGSGPGSGPGKPPGGGPGPGPGGGSGGGS